MTGGLIKSVSKGKESGFETLVRWVGTILTMIGVLFLAEKQLFVALSFVLLGSVVLGIWWLMRRQERQAQVHE